MATAVDYLRTAYLQAAERLAELDTVALDQRARFTHTTSQGVTYDWNGYRAALLNTLKELGGSAGQPGLIQVADGPFEIVV